MEFAKGLIWLSVLSGWSWQKSGKVAYLGGVGKKSGKISYMGEVGKNMAKCHILVKWTKT